jgi:hypothetical protein
MCGLHRDPALKWGPLPEDRDYVEKLHIAKKTLSIRFLLICKKTSCERPALVGFNRIICPSYIDKKLL